VAVPVVIDGYNLLYARGETPSPQSRARLVRDLVRWAERRGRGALVVFDAWDRGARHAHEERHGPLTVHFTRHGQRADAYIVEWVGAHPEAVVVSSDQAVQQGVRRRGAVPLGATAFLARLEAALRGSGERLDDEAEAETAEGEPTEGEARGRRARGRARWLDGL